MMSGFHRVSAAVVVTLVFSVYGVQALDEGFELLFTSQVDTFSDRKIHFRPPLPFSLHGHYIKNGLGRYEMGHRQFIHIFDAFAKLHKVTFRGRRQGRFSCQFLSSDFYNKSVSSDDIARYVLFAGAQPPFSKLDRWAALLRGLDNPNVNIIRLRRSERSTGLTYLAIGDFWRTYAFNESSLETIGMKRPRLPYGQALYHMIPIPSSAHPVPEPGTDNLITFYSLMSPIPALPSLINVIRRRSVDDTEIIAQIARHRLPYMHCLALTENYAIIVAHPVFIDIAILLETGTPFDSLQWEPQTPTDVYLVHLKTSKVLKFQVEGRFNMHLVNSYEDDRGMVMVDMVTYPDIKIISSLYLEKLMDKAIRDTLIYDAQLVHYTFDTNSLTSQTLVFHRPDKNLNIVNMLDFPAINPKFRFRKSCIVYGVVQKADYTHTTNSTLVKNNMCDVSGKSDAYWLREDHYPGEPWFVANPAGDGAEDDGILLTIVLDGINKVSYLLVLDAKTMTEVSRASLTTIVPFSLHGHYHETN